MDQQQTSQQAPPQSTPPPQQGSSSSSGVHGFLGQIENFFDEYLVRKAPFHLPEGLKEFLVKIAPWVTIIVMVLAIPLILAALGFSIALAPAAAVAGKGFGGLFWVSWVITLASFALEIMAIKGLMHREIRGWRFVYWASLLSVVSTILMGNFG